MGVMQGPVRPGFRPAPTGQRKSEEARKLRTLADKVETDHPETVVAGHLRDAAKALDRGSTKAASRHLAVARHTLTPQQLYRHGVTRGIDHTTARRNAGEVDRRMLAVRDIHDMDQDNVAHRQFRAAQQSQAEQDRARAAAERAGDPNRVISPAVMRPGQQLGTVAQSGSRPTAGQAAGTSLSMEQLHQEAIELVGKKGWSHGWVWHGPGPKPGGGGVLSQIRRTFDTNIASSGIVRGEGAWKLPVETGPERIMREYPGKAADDQIASGIWGAGRTHADHMADLGKLSPEQKTEYVRQTINGVGPAAALRAAQAHPKASHPGTYPAYSGMSPAESQNFDIAAAGFASPMELSADTARLAATPAPRGKPGGPGLYDVKGMGHTAYLQQIVKALIRKRGMPPGKAYAIARGAIRRWSRGGGKVHPEVQAAAGSAEAGEIARQTRAKAIHGHALCPADLREIWELAWNLADAVDVIELTGTAAGSAKDTRSGVTGQYVPAGSAQGSKGAPPAKGGKTAHQQHVAHVQHQQSNAQKKAALLKQAAADRQKAAGIAKKIAAFQKIIANAQKGTGKTISSKSNVTKTTAGSTTAASASTTAAAGATAASKAGSSTASKTASKTASATATASQAKKALPILQAQYKQLMAQAAALTAQAAKL